MIIDIKVPSVGESIVEVEVGEWTVAVGSGVDIDQPIVDIESEKATVEVPAPKAGVLVEILINQGEAANVGDVIGRIDTEKTATQPETKDSITPQAPSSKPAIMPSASRVMAQNNLTTDDVTGTGPGGRILKEDAIKAKTQSAAPVMPQAPDMDNTTNEHRVPMSPLRRTIASRLLEASQNMALLTTFNEVDMGAIKELRSTQGEDFESKHGVRLGFMSFFIKAAASALKEFPTVNAMVDGNDIVYRDSCDIGVAIGGGKGLVVPVIHNAQNLNFAQLEQQVMNFAQKAKNNKLTPEELNGGSFTISNGGVYGSMLSTPIVNPPQSAILGLHAIKDRPMAVNGEVVIRPVMYLALSYDHRIIDGREAVSFLKSIKERIEKPERMLLEL